MATFGKARAVLLSAVAACAPVVARAQPTAAAPRHVRNVILVHGAWADGSSWDKVIPLLEAKGYHVTAVHLAFTTLAADAATVTRALALEDGPTIVVGHSYGGAVISEAADDPKVAGLVYVAAFAPAVGQSAQDLQKMFPPTPGLRTAQTDAYGYVRLSTKGVMDDFAQDLPAPETRILAAIEGQINGKAESGAKLTHAAWQHKPAWYMVADDDRMISPALEAQLAARMHATTVHVASSHVIMLSHPAEVARVIESAAR